jgi:hypothetical protein
MNTGVIIKQTKKDWQVGAESGVVYKEVCQDWTPYLPTYESQQTNLIATQACATFSALNCIETQLKQQGIEKNLSDRFTAKMSGTTHQGNYLQYVLDSIRSHGWLLEEDYPFVENWDEYYKEIPQYAKDIAFKNKENADWQVHYEWLNIGDCHPNIEFLKYHLKQAPIQIATSFASGGCVGEHAMMLFKVDDKLHIFDSYRGGVVEQPLDYPLPYLMKVVVTKKVKPVDLPIPPLTRDLRFGDRLLDVKYLQRKLIKLGYLSKGLDTGWYGPLTKSAVYEFQKVNKVASWAILLWNQGRYVGLSTRKYLNLL